MKLKTTELAERCSESQRENFKLREEVQTLEQRISVLQRDMASKQISEECLLTEKRKLQTQVEELTLDIENKDTAYHSSIKAVEEAAAEAGRVAKETIEQLHSEIELARSKLQVEAESSDHLDSYKKRAQLALKKVSCFV
jgi:chromosome segregation ATPase